MNSKHHFLRLDGVKVAHSPHMVGDLGSTPSPGIRKGCCLVFICMRFYTIYILFYIIKNILNKKISRQKFQKKILFAKTSYKKILVIEKKIS